MDVKKKFYVKNVWKEMGLSWINMYSRHLLVD